MPSMWSAWKWVKKTSVNENPTPYRIIWRWVPSPQSNRSVSPSRCTRQAGDVAVDGRAGGAGAEEGDGQHAGR